MSCSSSALKPYSEIRTVLMLYSNMCFIRGMNSSAGYDDHVSISLSASYNHPSSVISSLQSPALGVIISYSHNKQLGCHTRTTFCSTQCTNTDKHKHRIATADCMTNNNINNTNNNNNVCGGAML